MCGSMRVGKQILRPGHMVPFQPIVGKLSHSATIYAQEAGTFRWPRHLMLGPGSKPSSVELGIGASQSGR